MKRELLAYEAPKVEVVEVQVEKGFAVSGQAEDVNPQFNGYGSEETW